MTERADAVHIRAAAVAEIIAHAREDAPDECCGLLVGPAPAGEPGQPGRSIDEAVRATNVERGPTRYRIDPVEHLRLQKRLRGTGRIVAGAYHSHPRAPAEPSATDVREAFYPDFVYVIVSLAAADAPEVRGWRIMNGEASEVLLIRTSD